MDKEQQADAILNDAAAILRDAIDNYDEVQEKSSTLDDATKRLRVFVDNRTDVNNDLNPLVTRAMDHALNLRNIADGLDTSVLATFIHYCCVH